MKKNISHILFFILIVSFLFETLPASAGKRTPKEFGPCADQVGPAYGLCNAYCEALNCDDSEHRNASEKACRRLEEHYRNITGQEFPCKDENQAVEQETAVCPTWSADELNAVGTTFPYSDYLDNLEKGDVFDCSAQSDTSTFYQIWDFERLDSTNSVMATVQKTRVSSATGCEGTQYMALYLQVIDGKATYHMQALNKEQYEACYNDILMH